MKSLLFGSRFCVMHCQTSCITLPFSFCSLAERVPVYLEPMPYAKDDTVYQAVLKVAEPLDFEEQSQYNLTLCVTNGLHETCRPVSEN